MCFRVFACPPQRAHLLLPGHAEATGRQEGGVSSPRLSLPLGLTRVVPGPCQVLPHVPLSVSGSGQGARRRWGSHGRFPASSAWCPQKGGVLSPSDTQATRRQRGRPAGSWARGIARLPRPVAGAQPCPPGSQLLGPRAKGTDLTVMMAALRTRLCLLRFDVNSGPEPTWAAGMSGIGLICFIPCGWSGNSERRGTSGFVDVVVPVLVILAVPAHA